MTADNRSGRDVELSIIILSYNTARLTRQTIESIYQTTNEQVHFEVIVLDNHSTDESPHVLTGLRKLHDNLHVIESNDNLGYSKGNNVAAKRAKGTYLLFLNSDIIVHEDAIEQLLQFLKNNQDAAFCGGKLLNQDGTDQPSCGPFYSLPVIFGALFLRGDYWGLTRSSPSTTRRVDWVSGACLLTTKQVFQKLHGFDEQIFMYMDEIDLLYRAKQKKYDTYFYPSAHFTHLASASSGGKTYPILQVYKGFLYFYRKHHSAVAVTLLKGMLQWKAYIAIWIGKITQNSYLTETYGKAQKLVEMA